MQGARARCRFVLVLIVAAAVAPNGNAEDHIKLEVLKSALSGLYKPPKAFIAL